MRETKKILNKKYLTAAVLMLVIGGMTGFAGEGAGLPADNSMPVVFDRNNDLHGAFSDSWIGLATRPSLDWSEATFELIWLHRVDGMVLVGINMPVEQVESSSGSSDVLEDPRLKGSVRDELGWNLTKSFINACWNLIDTTFVAYYQFQLNYY